MDSVKSLIEPNESTHSLGLISFSVETSETKLFSKIATTPRARPCLMTHPDIVSKILRGSITALNDPAICSLVGTHYGIDAQKASRIIQCSPRDLAPHLTKQIETIQNAAKSRFNPSRSLRGPDSTTRHQLEELKRYILSGDETNAVRVFGLLQDDLKAVLGASSSLTSLTEKLIYTMNWTGTSFIDQAIEFFSKETDAEEKPSSLIGRCQALIKTPPTHPVAPLDHPGTPTTALKLDHGIQSAKALKEILKKRGPSRHITDYPGYRREIHSLDESLNFALYPLLLESMPGAAPFRGEPECDYRWRMISSHPDLLDDTKLEKVIDYLTHKKEVLAIREYIQNLRTNPSLVPDSADHMVDPHFIDDLMRARSSLSADEFNNLLTHIDNTLIEAERQPLKWETPAPAGAGTGISSKMRILIVSAECKDIYSKGGLGTYTKEIAETLRDKGYEVTILLPDFAQRATATKIEHFALDHHFDGKRFISPVKEETLGEINYHYIQDNGHFELYEVSKTTPYDGLQEVRFGHFSSAVAAYVEAKKSDFDSVILNDWHAGFTPEILSHRHSAAFFRGELPPFLFMIHNAGRAAQGWFRNSSLIHSLGISSHTERSSMESAIQFADRVATVSPQYARELVDGAADELTPLLEKRLRNGTFQGILNGVSMKKPDADKDLYQDKQTAARELKTILDTHYRDKWGHIDLEGKEVVFFIGRYDSSQKGIRHLKHAMQAAHDKGAVFICAGTDADPEANRLLDELEAIAAKNHMQAMIIRDYKERERLFYQQGHGDVPGIGPLLRRVATVGAYVSDFEPCGLVQLEGFREGTPGCYTQVGGFVDSFTPLDTTGTDVSTGRGVPLDHHDIQKGFRDLIQFQQGLTAEQKNTLYRRIQQEGHELFSWESRITDYTKLLEEMRRVPSGGASAGAAAGIV